MSDEKTRVRHFSGGPWDGEFRTIPVGEDAADRIYSNVNGGEWNKGSYKRSDVPPHGHYETVFEFEWDTVGELA